MKLTFSPQLVAVLLSVASLLSGCRTVPHQDAATFAQGAAAAREQACDVFKTLNELARQSLIDYAVAQPILNDKVFVTLLDPTAVAEWETVFATLETYADHLIALTSPKLTSEYRQHALTLAQQIKATGENLKKAQLVPNQVQLTAPIATGFAQLGDILLRARAQHQARQILQEADPEVQLLFSAMATAIGATRTNGLRGTAWRHWDQRKAEQNIAFREATDKNAKRHVVEAYVDLRDCQAANDLSLAALERSLRALGGAHRALAEGRSRDAKAAVALIEREVDEGKKLYDEFKTALKPNEP